MSLIIKQANADTKSVYDSLCIALPEAKVSMQNKSTVIITKAKLLCVVRVRKNKLKISCDFNIKDPLILAFTIVGLLLGFLGVFIVFGIFYIIYFKSMREFRQQIYKILSN